ncbi:MAG TPA: type II toxin-antitoxin system death-on-curing family toxin [Candidatus Wunengus sp. YC63]|uniref:type II toxin-antitoxin system death-on-curing family toxin n=1 Tax=Candidatus Wunengus sp. YC63 TaxID=3367699 RepID=UPI002712579E|nr:type II toxin-antitoxin system death-on-curing family toxin [Candidatus Brocadiales bacterium]
MKRKKIVFLSLAEVVEIHNDQIQKYGGQDGIRDMNLLSSAVTMPYASFSGSFFHADIFEMASAYAFHISQNHPFLDGNKRTALTSALVFLESNGITITDTEGKLYDTMVSLASGKITKSEFAHILKRLIN